MLLSVIEFYDDFVNLSTGGNRGPRPHRQELHDQDSIRVYRPRPDHLDADQPGKSKELL